MRRGSSTVATLLSFGALLATFAVVACAATPTIPDDTPDPAPTQSPSPPGTTVVQEADASVPDTSTTACTTVPPNNKCGLAPQCGCGTNETCDVTNGVSGATSCVTAGGGTLGRPCNQTGDCLAGLGCVYGACRPYCGTALSKCTVAGTDLCVAVNDDANKPIPNKTVCTITCDPRVPAGVCGTNACHWFDTYYAPNMVSDCNFGGTSDALTKCAATGDCKPGLACIDHPKYGLECETWCRIGQVPSDCADKKFTCKDVFGANAPVINGVKEGVCQDPG